MKAKSINVISGIAVISAGSLCWVVNDAASEAYIPRLAIILLFVAGSSLACGWQRNDQKAVGS
jgi:peptidoglycan/LPS O-acetylase OafA/YrhL